MSPVTDCHVIPVCQENQGSEVAQVELAIRVGEGDSVKVRGLEARAQGSSVTAIFRMLQQTDCRTSCGGLAHDF